MDFENLPWKSLKIKAEQPTEWSDNGYYIKTFNGRKWVDGKSEPDGTCIIYRGGIHPWMTMAWAKELVYTDEIPEGWSKHFKYGTVGDKFTETHHIGPISYFWCKVPGEHPEGTFIDQSKDL